MTRKEEAPLATDGAGAARIDGKLEAAKLNERVRDDVADLRRVTGVVPGLAVVLVGDDPASRIYVRTKSRSAAEAGIRTFEFLLPPSVAEDELLALIEQLNARPDVHAILVQLPLPAHVRSSRVLHAVDPAKDVDGFHPYNVGLLGTGFPSLVPCTPLGVFRLAKTVRASLRGLEAVIVGRSAIVGRPAAQLFLLADCTVTLAHSATCDLPDVCRRADILVVAIGKAEFVRGGWVKPGATVLDVGINRVVDGSGKSRVVGDVDPVSVSEVAGALTPVPGGVGPMTVAVLLENTVRCARLSLGGDVVLSSVGA